MSAVTGPVPAITLQNRRLAADAILKGYNDTDAATAVSDAISAGWVYGQEIVSQVGGIIGGNNA